LAKHLLLVGGGHAHMVTLANLRTFIEKGHKVTVVGPSPYHYYSGMGPGMLGRTYTPDDIRFFTQHVVEKQGGTFILGKAVRVEPKEKKLILESGQSVTYDVLSFNVGSYVPGTLIEGTSASIFTVKPIEKLIGAQARTLELASRKKIAIGIVGGGPSAAEIAGNAWRLTQDYGKNKSRIRIFAGKEFMSRFPVDVKKRISRSLKRRGIEILESGFVKKVKTSEIILESGESYNTDVIFLAVGVKPSPIFKESDLPIGPDSGLLVNQYLQCTQYPEIFGGGDCIYFKNQPLDKVGVYAVRQNPILYQNLMASMEGGALQSFGPGPDYLLIFNMGGGTGVLHKRWITFDGRLAFKIKDYIDRKFMNKFQQIEKK
jgi:NADH dehydrogenase FAD-containing subunit